MRELFEVTTDYILKGIEPVNMINKKTMFSLYLGFAVIFGTIAGIWSFTANRFQWYECLEISILFAILGLGVGLAIHGIVNMKL